jgi:hypothetical protein
LRNPREAFIEYRTRFALVYEAREKIHDELVRKGANQNGHGFFDHDHPVAQTCVLIHEHEPSVRKAWLASLLHSLDRLMSEEEERETVERLLSLIPENELSSSDKDEIRVALQNHDGPNREEDSETQMILQDADRLANVNAIVIMRSGQFRSTIPTLELGHLGIGKNPESTFKNPRTAHDDLFNVLEWDPEGPEAIAKFCLRLPRAIEIGRPHFEYIRNWFRKLQSDFRALGLDPWPIE